MDRRTIKQGFVFLGVFAFAGCSGSSSQVELPETNMTTTGVAAATGAALGAGMGAIIGSATGDAGEGVAIGAVAGAVTGGVVGRQFEKQEDQLASQQETLDRQQQRIDEQSRQLNELKQGGLDQPVPYSPPPKTQPTLPSTFPSTQSVGSTSPRAALGANETFEIPPENAPSIAHVGSPAVYSGSPQAQHISGSNLNTQERADARENLRNEARARMGGSRPTYSDSPVKEESIAVGEMTAPRGSSNGGYANESANSAPVVSALPHDSKKSDKTAPDFTTNASLSSDKEFALTGTPSGLPPAKKHNASSPREDAASVEARKASTKSSLPDGANCTEADSEAHRAKTATSDADKLFYFRRAVKLCPMEPSYHVEIGKVYRSIGRVDDAQFEFNKALEIDPDNQSAQDELSMIMLNDKNTY